MKDFSLEDVEEYRNSYLENYKRETCCIDEKIIEYFVAPQSVNKNLPDFIGRVSNDETRKYVILISDSVPDKIRPYFVYGEYVEFVELGLNYKNSQVESEKKVLSKIPRDLRKEYIPRKTNLYKNALKLHYTNSDEYSLDKSGEIGFNNAILYLESIK